MNAQSLPSFSSFTALLNPQMEMEKMEDIVHSSFSPSYSIFVMFCDYFFCELGLHFFLRPLCFIQLLLRFMCFCSCFSYNFRCFLKQFDLLGPPYKAIA